MKIAQLKLLQHHKYSNYYCNTNGYIFYKKNKQKLSKNKKGYLVFRLKKANKIIYAHRFVTECLIKRSLKRLEYIDHLNGDKTNNNINNLRITNNSENLLNHTRQVGIYWDKDRNKWRAVISIVGAGKSKFLGRFKTKDDAIRKYKEAEKVYHRNILKCIS